MPFRHGGKVIEHRKKGKKKPKDDMLPYLSSYLPESV
jgi:hypothetical protein